MKSLLDWHTSYDEFLFVTSHLGDTVSPPSLFSLLTFLTSLT